MIRVIYSREPDFPAKDQHPDARRYQIGAYWVDAIGDAPTQVEIDAMLSPPVAQSLDERVANLEAQLVGKGILQAHDIEPIAEVVK